VRGMCRRDHGRRTLVSAAKVVSTGYIPRPLQDKIHAQLKRFNVLVCHRRFGKTVLSVNEMVDQALRCTRLDPQYAYIAPTYGQAERIAWDMLKRYVRNIPGVEFNESKLTCTIKRAHDRIKIMLLGAENPDSIRGIYLDGVIFDEFAEMDPRVWGEVVRPALSDRKGWAIFIGTPKGQNHFFDVYRVALANQDKGWFVAVFKASQTGVLPPEELEAMRAEMSEDQADQELECSFTAALTGAYFGKLLTAAENEGRIGKVPFDPALTVDTFWDLGVGDSMAIWFVQQHRLEIRFIDYFEMSGEGLDFYVKVLKGQMPGQEIKKKYTYRDLNWPHDGGSRDLVTGVERSVAMRELMGQAPIVHPRFLLADQHEAARMLIPKAHFDAERCARGLDALKNYQKKWDAKNKIFTDKPLHNWASHGSSAFCLAAMALKPAPDRAKKNFVRQADTQYDIFSV
jgi:phage terminase large subunit